MHLSITRTESKRDREQEQMQEREEEVCDVEIKDPDRGPDPAPDRPCDGNICAPATLPCDGTTVYATPVHGHTLLSCVPL